MAKKKYRVWCNDEDKWVYIWGDTEPTTCPTNNTHTINREITTVIDRKVEENIDRYGKPVFHTSPRKVGLLTCWTGRGDDPTNVDNVGGGDVIKISHKIGDPLVQTEYIDFNCIQNESRIYEGYIVWRNCNFDEINVEFVPRTVITKSGTNTNYNLHPNGYLIVAAPGETGTIEIQSDITKPNGGFVTIPPTSDPESKPVEAYWNSTWNTSTKVFENITADTTGNGTNNLFNEEVVLNRFYNTISLIGSNVLRITSHDSEEIGHGMRMKITATTNGEDHDWDASFIAAMYRQRTA